MLILLLCLFVSVDIFLIHQKLTLFNASFAYLSDIY